MSPHHEEPPQAASRMATSLRAREDAEGKRPHPERSRRIRVRVAPAAKVLYVHERSSMMRARFAGSGGRSRGVEAASLGSVKGPQAAFTEIPMIDVSALFAADAASRFACGREIGRACRDVGFFYAVNHRIAQPRVD